MIKFIGNVITSSTHRFTLKMILPCKQLTQLLHAAYLLLSGIFYSLSGNFWRQFIVFHLGFNDNSWCSTLWEQGRERWAGNSIKYVVSWRPETHPNRISDCYWKLIPKWPTHCSKRIVEPGVGSNIWAQSQLHLYCPCCLQCNITGSTPQWNFHIPAVCQLQKNVLELTRFELQSRPWRFLTHSRTSPELLIPKTIPNFLKIYEVTQTSLPNHHHHNHLFLEVP